MYPGLPRWSDTISGALSASQRMPPSTVLPRASVVHTERGTSSGASLPAPGTRSAQAPTAQTKMAGRSGQLFVNHNAAPAVAASPHAPTPPTASSSSTLLPPSTPSASTTVAPHRGSGRSAGLSQQTGRNRGGAPYLHDTDVAGQDAPYAARPIYATNRHGLARGTTVANVVEAPRRFEAPLSLGVEGTQTGEGVVVDVSAARHRSLTGNGAPAACSHPQDHALLPQLKRQLEKATASIKSLTAANRLQKQELADQRSEREVLLAECEARLRAAVICSREREVLLSHHVLDLVKRSSEEAQRAKLLVASAKDAHNADKSKWEAELASLRRSLDAASASAASQATKDSAAVAHSAELEGLEAELDALRQSSAETQHKLENALADAQSTLNRTEEELQECRQAQHQCNYLAQQCRLFIRQVCQPSFSVVKGPSLEPVEKDRPEPTGFVLVPLTVLLHGYTLLPEDDRQEVIEHYDREAKALH